MPNGKTHQRHHKLAWPFVVPLAYISTMLTERIVMMALVPLGYFIGSFVEPDLDLVGTTASERKAKEWFGPLALPWLMWWYGYAIIISLFGGHRSPLSHWPILSTIIRLVWLALPCVAILKWVIEADNSAYMAVYDIAWRIGIGLAFSDVIHIFADWFTKGDSK